MSTAVAPRRRPLTLFERVLYGDARWPGNVTATASIDGRVDEHALRRALAQVQAKHPLLRCLIVDDGARPWFVLQDAPPPIPLQIVARRGDDDWIVESAFDLGRTFDGSREPLARLTWLRGDARSDLVLVCHHAICDGKAIVALLGDLVAVCGTQAQAIGHYDSLAAFADRVPDAVRNDRRLQRGIRWRAALLRFVLLTLVRRRARPTPAYGLVYREVWTVDDTIVRRLAHACRARQVSVYVAVAQAFVDAFRAVCGVRRIARFQTPVDMRRFVPSLAPDKLFAVAPTLTLRPRDARDDDGDVAAFWLRAQALGTDLRRRLDRYAPRVYRNFLGMERLHDVYDRMLAYGQSQRAGRQVTLSYLGRVPLATDYGALRLRAVRGVSAWIGPTPAHLVLFSCFADRLDFSLASDEASLPIADALAIRDRVNATLRTLAAPSPAASPTDVGAAQPVQAS